MLIRIGKKRIRIQLLVNDFCDFYFPYDVLLVYIFFKEVIIIYYKANKKF